MNRQEKKREIKQKKTVDNLIKRFLKKYNDSIEKVKKGEIKKDNRLKNISDVNVVYLEVWRNLIAKQRKDYPLAPIDGNFFEPYLIWGDEKEIPKLSILEKIKNQMSQ